MEFWGWKSESGSNLDGSVVLPSSVYLIDIQFRKVKGSNNIKHPVKYLKLSRDSRCQQQVDLSAKCYLYDVTMGMVQRVQLRFI